MTATTHGRMNVALALAVPATGLAYLMAGSGSYDRHTLAVVVALGVVWMVATAAVNTIPHPQPGVVPARGVAPVALPRRLTSVSPTHVNVSRPVTPWRWTDVALAPVQAVALAWGVGSLVLLVIVPVGLALAGALWFSRLVLR
jgi:hypothetical protein